MKSVVIVRIVRENFVINISSSIKLARLMKKKCRSEVWGVAWCDHAVPLMASFDGSVNFDDGAAILKI